MGLAAFNLPVFLGEMEFHEMAHSALDKWLDTFKPFFESESPPGLRSLSDHFQNTRQMFLGACLQAAVERLRLFTQAHNPHHLPMSMSASNNEATFKTLQEAPEG